MAADEQPVKRRRLTGYAKITAMDFSIFDEPSGDELRCIDRDRKAYALCGQNDRRVHADDFAVRRDKRTTGISRIQCGIGLNDVIDQPARLRSQRASKRADDTRSDCRLETVRISDSNHKLAHTYGLGITKRYRSEIRRGNPHDGKIRVRILSNSVGAVTFSVGEYDMNRARTVNDVAVGQNESIRCENKSGTGPTSAAAAILLRFNL